MLEDIERFNNLPIQKASLTSILAKPYSKFVLELTLGEVGGDVVNIYELQFNRIADVVVDAVGMPWFGKIVSCKATFADDFYPRSHVPSQMVSEARLMRFIIDADRGHFEVIAENYAFTMVQRIASVGRIAP